METKQAIIWTLAEADMFVDMYLADFSDVDLLVRPVPGANPIAWQLGHLILAERGIVERLAPGKMGPAPEGFADKYGRGKPASDNPADYLPKEAYAKLLKETRSRTLQVLAEMTDADLDRDVGPKAPPLVKRFGQAFIMMAIHTMMHVGQWAVVRRKLERAPLF